MHTLKYGGLSFLLKCNYDLKHFDKNLPLFYREMLDYFNELRSSYTDMYKSEFILWNNKHITIENRSIFWRNLFERGICFVRDLLDKNGQFLSLEKFQLKYNAHFQLIAAIPNHLKKNAMENVIPDGSILEECDVFHLSDNKTILLTNMRCKDYYKFLSGKGYNRTYSCEVLV